jgi:beta-glucosidase
LKQTLKFPTGFLWGAATSAHQIEGNNTNSDWWAWEKSVKRHDYLIKKGKNPKDFESGIACDSYNRFEEDFELAEHLGHNAHRLGIEWARIEPEEGKYSEKELDHYEKVLRSAKAHNLTLFLTLHHFTSPLWFMKKGGFEKKENVACFVNFAQKVIQRFDQYVDFWITFNEPEGYTAVSYISGVWPPQKHNLLAAFKVARNITLAHSLLMQKARHITKKPFGMAHNMVDLTPTGRVTKWMHKFLFEKINKFVFNETIDSCDFIGLNYYFHHHLEILGKRKHSHSHHEKTDVGWGIHPEGLERILLNLSKYKKPIYITENGLADASDSKREKFIRDHLFYMHKAIGQGADVRGYLHWSLMDNFEWEKGFAPRFGLIEIDRGSLLERKARYSAIKYAEICRNNYLEIS